MENSPRPFLTYAEASDLTRYTITTLRQYVYLGVFREDEHYVRPRGKVLFIREKLLEWLTRSISPSCGSSSRR